MSATHATQAVQLQAAVREGGNVVAPEGLAGGKDDQAGRKIGCWQKNDLGCQKAATELGMVVGRKFGQKALVSLRQLWWSTSMYRELGLGEPQEYANAAAVGQECVHKLWQRETGEVARWQQWDRLDGGKCPPAGVRVGMASGQQESLGRNDRLLRGEDDSR